MSYWPLLVKIGHCLHSCFSAWNFERQEKKYCDDCKEVITAKSELALPNADIGLNYTILICYLWVALCLPFTKIKDYLKAFFGKTIVVRRVLGEIFFGLLVVDGWGAYFKLICEQQSCMAHLLRKIRKFRDAFPSLTSIVKFYLKLRRILLDGERLQINREKLGEKVFKRRRKRLYPLQI